MGICCMAQETQTQALYQPRGMGWGGRMEGGSKGGEYVYLWLIHVEIWQKTIQFYKAFILQEKEKTVLRAKFMAIQAFLKKNLTILYLKVQKSVQSQQKERNNKNQKGNKI